MRFSYSAGKNIKSAHKMEEKSTTCNEVGEKRNNEKQ